MARTAYTFPSVNLLGGSTQITVYTSGGDGTPVAVEDRYFSDLVIDEDTEQRGGQVKSFTADFTIEDDKDDLFSGTILPYLYAEDGYVQVKVVIDNVIRFYGSVLPNSVQNGYYYAENDALEGSKKKITFRCNWILEQLKSIQMDAVRTSILTDGTKYIRSFYEFGLKSDFVTLQTLIQEIFSILNSDYGINVNVSAEQSDYTFMTQDAGGGDYIYGFEGNVSPGSIGIQDMTGSLFGISKVGLVLTTIYTTNESGEDVSMSDYFNPQSDKYFGTAYDFFVGLIKSFGYYPKAQYDNNGTYDLILLLATRTSGNVTVIRDTLTHDDSLFNILSSDSIQVNSLVSGNSFTKVNNIYGATAYNEQTAFDFANDSDFPGGSLHESNVNTDFSLMLAGTFSGTRKYTALVRYCAIGNNFVSNGDFSDGLTDWDKGSSHFTTSGGYAVTDRFGSNEILIQDLPGVTPGRVRTEFLSDKENSLLQLDIWTDTPSSFSGLAMYLYASPTELITSRTVAITGSGWHTYVLKYEGKKKIKRVVIATPYLGIGSLSAVVKIGNVKLRRNRSGCPELLGKVVADYFNNKNLTIKRISVNGISPYAVCDYVMFGGEKYYIKRATYRVKDNTTEIEAINYPY